MIENKRKWKLYFSASDWNKKQELRVIFTCPSNTELEPFLELHFFSETRKIYFTRAHLKISVKI